MTYKVSKSFPSIVVMLVFCVVQAKGHGNDDCSLYQVNESSPSLPIHLKNNQDTYLMFNHIVNNASQTKILNDGGECLVGLKHFSYQEMDCQVQFYTEEENSTLVFTQREDSLMVFKKSENDVKFNRKLKELWFVANDKIDVALDCVNNCEWISLDGDNPGKLLLLDNHDIYVRIVFINKDSNLWIQKMDEIHDCLLFISRRARIRSTSKCTGHFRSDGDETRLVFRNHNGSLTIRKLETVYNLIGNSHTLKITSDTPVNVSSKCSENDYSPDDVPTDGASGNGSCLQGPSEIHHHVIAAVGGILVPVSVALCIYIGYLKRRLERQEDKKKRNPETPNVPNTMMGGPPAILPIRPAMRPAIPPAIPPAIQPPISPAVPSAIPPPIPEPFYDTIEMIPLNIAS